MQNSSQPVKHIMSADVRYRYQNFLSLLKSSSFLCNTLQRLHGACIRDCASGFLRKCTAEEVMVDRSLSFERFFWTITAPLRRIHCSVEQELFELSVIQKSTRCGKGAESIIPEAEIYTFNLNRKIQITLSYNSLFSLCCFSKNIYLVHLILSCKSAVTIQ